MPHNLDPHQPSSEIAPPEKTPSGRHDIQPVARDPLEESLDVDLTPFLEQGFYRRLRYLLLENATLLGVVALIIGLYLYSWHYISWLQLVGIFFEGMLLGVIWTIWKGPLLTYEPVDIKNFRVEDHPKTLAGTLFENMLSHGMVVGFYGLLVFSILYLSHQITFLQAQEGAGVIAALGGFRGLYAGIHECLDVKKAQEVWRHASGDHKIKEDSKRLRLSQEIDKLARPSTTTLVEKTIHHSSESSIELKPTTETEKSDLPNEASSPSTSSPPQ